MELRVILLLVLYSATATVGLPGNLMVIFVSYKKAKRLRTHTLMSALAVNDGIANTLSITNILLLLVSGDTEWRSVGLCKFIYYLEQVLFLMSTLLNSAIVLDRYYTVHKLAKYKRTMTVPRVMAAVCILIISASLMTSPAPVLITTSGTPRDLCGFWWSSGHHVYYLSFIGIIMIASAILILLTNVKIWKIVRNRQRHRPSTTASPNAIHDETSNGVSDFRNGSCPTLRPPRYERRVYICVTPPQSEPVENNNCTRGSLEFALPGQVIITTDVVPSGVECNIFSDIRGNVQQSQDQVDLSSQDDDGSQRQQTAANPCPSEPQQSTTMINLPPATLDQNLDRESAINHSPFPHRPGEDGPACKLPIVNHVSKMLLAVTLAFVVTRIPSIIYLAILTIRNVPSAKQVVTGMMTASGAVAFMTILGKLYIVGYAVNPFIYLMNPSYRQDVLNKFRRR